MEIKYFGHSCFQIKTKDAKVVTDPYDPSIGIKLPKLEADVVTVSHQHPDHNNTAAVSGTPLVLDWPGDFEKNKVRITGFKSFHDKSKGAERGENILYKIETENISILHCGDLGLVLDDSFIDEVGEVDILIVPTGGFYTIDSTEAVALVKKIEPRIVIPMHYNGPQLNQDHFGKLSNVDDFLHKLGVTAEPTPKLVIKKEEMGEEMKVVVMEISNS